jgi:hypothetical protein
VSRREPSPYAGKTVKIRADVPNPPNGAVIAGQEYLVEDWWVNASGGSWMDSQTPAAWMYAARTAGTPIDNEVPYGKVGSLGHLVHVSEIEVPDGGEVR